MPAELPALTVANKTLWRQWLLSEHAASSGVWLTLAKKATTSPTNLTWQQAIEEAMCFGWIDGQARKLNETTYSQRFQPRAKKSMWSKRNVGIVARLENEGRMQEAGRAAVEAAKSDGRWNAAYEGSAEAKAPEDFLAELAKVPSAQATWDVLNKQNRYAIYFRLNGLKTPAGRQKRIAAFVDMLAKGDTPMPQKKSEKPRSVRTKVVAKVTRPVETNRQTRSSKRNRPE